MLVQENLWETYGDVQEIINESRVDEAREIITDAGLLMPKRVSQ